jgi:hypothetical protein
VLRASSAATHGHRPHNGCHGSARVAPEHVRQEANNFRKFRVTVSRELTLDKKEIPEIMMIVPANQLEFHPTHPDREQFRHVLAAALSSGRPAMPRPLCAYEPLAWLLKESCASAGVRRARRSLYRRLVRDLAQEFDGIYAERMTSANGPWDFKEVYEASARARSCIRRMRWCAFLHAMHIPAAATVSTNAYAAMLALFGVSRRVSAAAAEQA